MAALLTCILVRKNHNDSPPPWPPWLTVNKALEMHTAREIALARAFSAGGQIKGSPYAGQYGREPFRSTSCSFISNQCLPAKAPLRHDFWRNIFTNHLLPYPNARLPIWLPTLRQGSVCHAAAPAFLGGPSSAGPHPPAPAPLHPGTRSAPHPGWRPCRAVPTTPPLHRNLESSKQRGRIKVSKCRSLSQACPPTRSGAGKPNLASGFPRRRDARVPRLPGSPPPRDPHVGPGLGTAFPAEPRLLGSCFCTALSTPEPASRAAGAGKRRRSLPKGACLSGTLSFNSFQGAWLSNSPLSLWLEGIMLRFFSLQWQGRALLAFPFWSATVGTHWTFSSALQVSSCRSDVREVVQGMQF